MPRIWRAAAPNAYSAAVTSDNTTAIELSWRPPAATEAEHRTLDPTLIGPADDIDVLRYADISAVAALRGGGSLGALVMWWLAGRQARIRPPERLDRLAPQFTLAALAAGGWTETGTSGDGPDDGPDADPLAPESP